MSAKLGDTVRVHYIGRFNDVVFDSSKGSDPIQFTLGEGQVIPGFEHAIEGMDEGDVKSVTIHPDEAYGPHLDELMMHVEKNQLPPDLDPQVGEHLEVQTPDGDLLVVKVADKKESDITLDANHPLAGKDLTFEIELIEVMH